MLWGATGRREEASVGRFARRCGDAARFISAIHMYCLEMEISDAENEELCVFMCSNMVGVYQIESHKGRE
jgi:hypothetical protein